MQPINASLMTRQNVVVFINMDFDYEYSPVRHQTTLKVNAELLLVGSTWVSLKSSK